jgi:ribosomal protein RSM22 (predicted rRNA methylase)
LQTAIDDELARQPTGALNAAVAGLLETYAHGRPSVVADDTWHAAYLAVRMPATYAAVQAALVRVPDDALRDIGSVLDLGAGPGTASWAALASCPALTTITQIDRSPAMLEIGRRLAGAAAQGRRLDLTQRTADVTSGRDWPAADLVTATYALAELSAPAMLAVVTAAWRATTRLLVLVEPGTPAGFERIHAARAALLAAGAGLVSPCPHEGPCPMRTGTRQDDWCHFAVRVPRTRRHRQLKGGSLGYEDEKFAYLVASRGRDQARPQARVLRHPRIDKGRITLTLCTAEGARRQVITRRDAAWSAARKAEWGDGWATAPDADDA